MVQGGGGRIATQADLDMQSSFELPLDFQGCCSDTGGQCQNFEAINISEHVRPRQGATYKL